MKAQLSVVALTFCFGVSVSGLHAQGAGRSLGVVFAHTGSSGGPERITGCAASFFPRAVSHCPPLSRAKPVSLSTVEIEMVLPLLRHSWWGLEYPIVAVPMAVVRNNQTGTARLISSTGQWVILNPPPRATTHGFGIKPIGLRGWAGPHHVRLQGDVSAGFLRFGAPLLASNAARFNFTAELGIGVRVEMPERGHVVLGYRLHHVSNGGFGEFNPGLDSHLLYLGLWFQ